MSSAIRPQPQIPHVAPRTNALGTTVLFALEPKGLGTDAVESLSGFIRRLSGLHVKRHGLLLERLILQPHRISHPADAGTFGPIAYLNQAINGGLKMGAIIVAHLEALTGVPTVRRTTFYGRSDDLYLRRTFRTYRAWCPECLEEDGAEPYDRLLWSLRAATVCPVHERELTDQCSKCKTQWRPLRSNIRETECAGCGTSLTRRSPRAKLDALTVAASDFILRLETGTPVTHQQIANGVAYVLRSAGSYRAAHELGFMDTSMHRLMHYSKRVELGMLLPIVARSGQNLQSFLAHEVRPKRLRPASPRVLRASPSVKNGAKAIAEMRRLLAGKESVESMRALCVRMKVTREWLYRTNWELARRFVVRGKRDRHQRKLQRLARQRALVEREVRRIHRTHGQISWHLVNTHLSQPGLIRDRSLAAVARRVMNELRKSEEAT